jgi:hypothetical protein
MENKMFSIIITTPRNFSPDMVFPEVISVHCFNEPAKCVHVTYLLQM